MTTDVPCYIYRSKKTDELYLFLAKEDDFACVPEDILKGMGVLEKSMTLELNEQTSLARSKTVDVLSNLKEHGFHIQLPPPKVPT